MRALNVPLFLLLLVSSMKATHIAYSSNPLIHRMVDGSPGPESANSPNGVQSRPGFVSPSGLPPSPDLGHHDPDQEALPPLVRPPPSPSESQSSRASTEFAAHASPPELGSSSSGSGSPSPPPSPGPRTPSPVHELGSSTADIEFASSPPLPPSSPLDLPRRRRRASSTSNRSTSPAKRHKPL